MANGNEKELCMQTHLSQNLVCVIFSAQIKEGRENIFSAQNSVKGFSCKQKLSLLFENIAGSYKSAVSALDKRVHYTFIVKYKIYV